MNHLTPDELIDALEGALGPERGRHLAACAACRGEAARAAAMLRDVRQVEMPEPSPLFWDRFGDRVRAAIAAEDIPRRGWAPPWLRWPVLVPIGALALIVMALATAIPRVAPPSDPNAMNDKGASVPDDLARLGEQEWAVLSELVGPVDLDLAHEAGIVVAPGAAERAALELSAAEQRELVRLLKEEMDRPGG